MAVYGGAAVKIIIGEVTASQDSTMAGSFASESNAYITTLDSSTNEIISTTIEQKWDDGTKYVFTCVSGT
tara:strand:+ start:221 stop:430 length:210 start_codon:yes stop_codon:yes gene_type:complete